MRLLGLEKHAATAARPEPGEENSPNLTEEARQKILENRGWFLLQMNWMKEHRQEVSDWCDRQFGSPAERYKKSLSGELEAEWLASQTHVSPDAILGTGASDNEPGRPGSFPAQPDGDDSGVDR